MTLSLISGPTGAGALGRAFRTPRRRASASCVVHDSRDILGRIQREQARPPRPNGVVAAELERDEAAVPERLRVAGIRREHFLDEAPRLAA